jgi:hypothetical protein
MTESGGQDWEALLKAGAATIGAARLAKAVAVGLDGAPLAPDTIALIEKLTGERYDPAAGTWSGADPP